MEDGTTLGAGVQPGIQLRPIGPEELKPFFDLPSTALAFPPATQEMLAVEEEHKDLSRTLAAFDDGQIVGTADSFLFELTVPGGATVPTAGVTLVSVASTHRRRGLLRTMMHRQLAEARERGEVAAALLASESIIYGRFGYGLAASVVDIEIDPRHAAFLRPLDVPGRLRIVDEDTFDEIAPSIYARAARQRAGGIDRPAGFWAMLRSRRPSDRRAQMVLYVDQDGSPTGYVVYTVEGRWSAGVPDHRLTIQELVSTTPDATAALWRHCLDADLVRRVTASNRSVDEPLRWLLADPRHLRITRLSDFLWLRLLDIPRALEARTYASDGELTVSIADPVFGDESTYALTVTGGVGRCRETSAAPDIRCGVAELSACYLGGASFADLASAWRVTEHSAGAVGLADAMFDHHPPPWCQTFF